jgi:hypothetical protein
MSRSVGIVNVLAGADAAGVALEAARVADGDGVDEDDGVPTGPHAAVRIAMSTGQLRMR